MSAKPGMKYMACNGLDIAETYAVAKEAEAYIRRKRMPVFLHMRCVRLLGHAGSDVEHTYLTHQEIYATERNDPLYITAAHCMQRGLLSGEEVLARYNGISRTVSEVAEMAIKAPRHSTAKAVMESIVPPKRKSSAVKPSQIMRDECFGKKDIEACAKPQHMSRLLSWALTDLMLEHPHMVMAGEDIGPKGGVYGVTSKLHRRFGPQRIINTLLDEQTILGLAIGMAQNGILPMPEIQFLAYLHNAEDQLRGEASTLSFFSDGQYTNPMVLRVAGLAYQRGFGGHFHNDNSIAVLRDLPGVIVACPSNGHDAVRMLRECVRLAEEEQRVVVFIEPIALYSMKDLHAPGDEGWSFAYADAHAAKSLNFAEVGSAGTGKDLCILTYGNGYYLSMQAQKELKELHNVAAKIVDIRWLSPLPEEAIAKAVKGYSHVLVVDECRRSGSPSEAIMALLAGGSAKLARHCAEDSFIPIGNASTLTLPSKESIVKHALDLLK